MVTDSGEPDPRVLLDRGREDVTELRPDPYEQPRVRDLEQDIELKKTYARTLLTAMLLQLAIADAVFVTYAWAGAHWRLTATVINVWLVGTLVEVIGVVLVVTRYLFPRREGSS
jgi:hypothetical protein